MDKVKVMILLMSISLVGCASQQPKIDMGSDASLVQLPPDIQQATSEAASQDEEQPFQDISFSDQKRLYALTNKAEIDKDNDQYVKNGQAEVITRPDGSIEFPYGLTEAIITAKKMMYSKIVLQEGEKITHIDVGDNVRWHIDSNYIGDTNDYTPVVLIKPFFGGLQTSLSITTDKRDYDIIIRSVESGDFMQRTGFYYPQDLADAVNVPQPPVEDSVVNNSESRAVPKIDLSSISYPYTVLGNNRLSWLPKRVFTDGKKVFIEMPHAVSRSELPAFMAINFKGQREMVNFRYYRPYFVIDTLFDKGILVMGTDKYQQIVTITKIK
jgi:type IV secretion system protein TrbG